MQLAHVVAVARHRIRTLAVRQDALIVVLRGRKQLLTSDACIEAGPRSGVVIAAGTTWDVVNDPRLDGRYEALALSFSPAQVDAFHAEWAHQFGAVLVGAKALEVDVQLAEAVHRIQQGQTMSDALLHHRTHEVLLLLHERGFRFAPVATVAWSDRVRRLVASRPQADWTAASIAQVFHLSESSLRRRLGGEGLPLFALVREVRLEVALGMLQTSLLPVGEVAQHCGWGSHSRFSKAFAERWGFLPSVLRQRDTV